MRISHAHSPFVQLLGGQVGQIYDIQHQDELKDALGPRIDRILKHILSLLAPDFPMQHALFLMRQSILPELTKDWQSGAC